MNRGLIEAHRPGGAGLEFLQLPRFMNRGLIEAPTGAAIGTAPRPLPRFMNRGLIEAEQVQVAAAGRGDFPDS